MPVPCAFFFSAEFFSAPCTDAAPLHRCRADAAGSGTMGIRPPRRRRRSPGLEVRVGVSGRAPGRKSGALFPEFGTEAPGRKSGAGLRRQGAGAGLRRQGAGAGFRVPHRTVGSRGRKAFSAPRDRMFPRRRRRSPGSGFGKSAGRPAAGPAVPGPGSWSAADSGAGFVLCGRFRGACAGRRFPGSDRAVCRRPSACAESFPGRKRFPRSMSEGAEIRGPLSRAEAARGVPEVGFPGRGPAAGDFCDGRILRRRIGAIRLRP